MFVIKVASYALVSTDFQLDATWLWPMPRRRIADSVAQIMTIAEKGGATSRLFWGDNLTPHSVHWIWTGFLVACFSPCKDAFKAKIVKDDERWGMMGLPCRCCTLALLAASQRRLARPGAKPGPSRCQVCWVRALVAWIWNGEFNVEDIWELGWYTLWISGCIQCWVDLSISCLRLVPMHFIVESDLVLLVL